MESASLLASLCTPERQSLCESHRQRRWLTYWSYGDAWMWVAFAPAWHLVVASVVGKRTQANAHRLLRRVVTVTDAPIPFCTSDQLSAYAEALLAVYGQWSQPERQGTRGRYSAPRRMPLPNLLYAQVVKPHSTELRGDILSLLPYA